MTRGSIHLGDVVTTKDGSMTLRHPEHGECYHSDAGATLEAKELYVAASGIEARWNAPLPVTVLDIGLGLGYNALCTIASWQAATNPQDLAITSLEIDRDLALALASGQAPWQSNWRTEDLLAVMSLKPKGNGLVGTMHHPRAGAVCDWNVVIGDARDADLGQGRRFDFIWQDAFSPSKNPVLWNADWFGKVAAASAPGAVLMTYSVARVVRDALGASGWRFEKIPTAGRAKRHWLRATLHEPA